MQRYKANTRDGVYNTTLLSYSNNYCLWSCLGNRNQVRCQPNIAINNNSQEKVMGEILALAILSFKIQEENKIQFHHSHSSSLGNGSALALAETAKAPLLSISVLLWQKGPFTWVPKLPYTYNSAVR